METRLKNYKNKKNMCMCKYFAHNNNHLQSTFMISKAFFPTKNLKKFN